MNVIEQINKASNLHYYTPRQVNEFLLEVGDDFSLLRTNKKTEYYNIPASFDIETTSFRVPNQLGAKEKRSIMCEWTLGINFVVMVGRTWDEFMSVYDAIVEHFQLNFERRLIIYAHNLSFEFQAIRKMFQWERVFALDKRKPVQTITVEGVEFRCSYLLSGYSLEKLAENLTKYKVQKLVGNWDYDKIRHTKTPLTSKEIGYCINDVMVVMAYIQETIERDGDIRKIPLTKTGYVRNYCRNNCFYVDKTHRKGVDKYKKYRNLMLELTVTPDEYEMLSDAFMGGFVHANPHYARKVMNNVKSYDFSSSYPSVMISEKFPMSKGEVVQIKDKDEFNKNLFAYCCLFDISFDGIRAKEFYENYIPQSKCRKLKGGIENNGRIVEAEHLEITITEQDFFIINQMYEWDSVTIGKFIRYKKNYLPKDLVLSILNLFIKKTELKGIKGKEVEYLVSKENLNSCYGMMVTDILRDDISYEYDLWEGQQPDINEAIEKYNSSKRRFLFYPWGIWVTAYARFNLFTGIYEFKNDYIYSDTDSLKVINFEKHAEYINKYNEEVNEKINKALEYHGIDKDMINVKNKKGERKYLGIWEDEGIYDKFKTLGAKRYMVETNGEISITVSGLNKKKAVPYLKSKYGDKVFEVFDEDLAIPAQYTGKMTHTYIDDEISGYVTDYRGIESYFSELSGTHLENCEYDLSLSTKYVNFLLGITEHEK